MHVCTHNMKWSEVKPLSCVQLFATSWTVAYQALPSMGFFQARILEWVAISFSRRSSRPRDWTRVSRIVGRCFTIWATREIPSTICIHIILEVYYTLGFTVLCTLKILNILPYQFIAGCRIPFFFFWSRQTPWLNSSCRPPPLEGKQLLKCSNSLCLTTTAGVDLFTSDLLEISAGVMYRMWGSSSLDLPFQDFPLNFQRQCSWKGSPWLNRERICWQWRRPKFDPGPRISPGGENSNILQYSYLENLIDRGAWWATVHRVAKSQTWMKRLSTCSWTLSPLTLQVSKPRNSGRIVATPPPAPPLSKDLRCLWKQDIHPVLSFSST